MIGFGALESKGQMLLLYRDSSYSSVLVEQGDTCKQKNV